MTYRKPKTPEQLARCAEMDQRAAKQKARKSEIAPAFVAAFATHMREIRVRNGVGRPPQNKPVRDEQA